MAGTWWPALRAGELIAYLTDEELERLDAVTVPVMAEPGDAIFFKGAPSKSLIIVEEGEVEAFEEAGGRVSVLGSAGARPGSPAPPSRCPRPRCPARWCRPRLRRPPAPRLLRR